MAAKRRYCPQGHDTTIHGRDSSYRCLECKRLAAQESWAVRREQRLAQEQAEAATRQRQEDKRRERKEAAARRRILAAGGEAAIELLQYEAWEAGLCGWEIGPGAVCRRSASRETFVWCRLHNRQLDREQAAKKAAEQ
jgi:hypothetical protein